ncbi:uncharacterized protein LOC112340697 [Selaginella moellendorffii]|uniref:uncharacterized protein LOC112340697 n=1 Tax=Selaginella moellendorffii TaxID=88036 RepID=UPI000D1CF1F5|nr:uncharacterized protein LOC112340697 [Selaginella moellendorffii]|eukprot:XP_024515301.1 uncharacterized protein LOC112340697 [Selaginella moellendorffii]
MDLQEDVDIILHRNELYSLEQQPYEHMQNYITKFQCKVVEIRLLDPEVVMTDQEFNAILFKGLAIRAMNTHKQGAPLSLIDLEISTPDRGAPCLCVLITTNHHGNSVPLSNIAFTYNGFLMFDELLCNFRAFLVFFPAGSVLILYRALGREALLLSSACCKRRIPCESFPGGRIQGQRHCLDKHPQQARLLPHGKACFSPEDHRHPALNRSVQRHSGRQVHRSWSRLARGYFDSSPKVEVMMQLEENCKISLGEERTEKIVTVQDAADLIQDVIGK